MAEVLDRRFAEYFKNKDSGEGFGRLPDLILLDGGKGQVNAVLPVLAKHGLDIPLFGMVKDSHHRTRAIACSGDELSLTSKRAAFTLVFDHSGGGPPLLSRLPPLKARQGFALIVAACYRRRGRKKVPRAAEALQDRQGGLASERGWSWQKLPA